MTPNVTTLQGDVFAMLPTLRDRSVHCIVTSPPYWGLRDYGVQGQLGLEKIADCLGWATKERCDACYVCRMVSVFREARRVLRDDGILWLNLGDSYAGSWGSQGRQGKTGKLLGRTAIAARQIAAAARKTSGTGRIEPGSSLKPKDLCMVPARVALALQADGWFLRSDCIWDKPNPMPESIKDRPSRAHEYVFLLAKSSRYFYDEEAVAVAAVSDRPSGNGYVREEQINRGGRGQIKGWMDIGGKRRLRTVWRITSKPFKGAHFATFPPGLAETCILAGTSAGGCCPACESPYLRIIEKGSKDAEWIKACGANRDGTYHGQAQKDYAAARAQDPSAVKARILESMRTKRTIGWMPSCVCAAGNPIPCTVLDPFAGSCTTGEVAVQHGRSFVGIDLNPEYVTMGRDRIAAASKPKPAKSRRRSALRPVRHPQQSLFPEDGAA